MTQSGVWKMADPINNTVCKACGATKSIQENLGLNEVDCRYYEQMLIKRKAFNVEQEQNERRMRYFGYLG